MAFNVKDFQPNITQSNLPQNIGTADAFGAPRIFAYSTNDTQVQVAAANYFDSIYDLLEAGDVIIAIVESDAVGWTQVWFSVRAVDKTAKTVTVSAGTVLGT